MLNNMQIPRLPIPGPRSSRPGMTLFNAAKQLISLWEIYRAPRGTGALLRETGSNAILGNLPGAAACPCTVVSRTKSNLNVRLIFLA